MQPEGPGGSEEGESSGRVQEAHSELPNGVWEDDSGLLRSDRNKTKYFKAQGVAGRAGG